MKRLPEAPPGASQRPSDRFLARLSPEARERHERVASGVGTWVYGPNPPPPPAPPPALQVKAPAPKRETRRTRKPSTPGQLLKRRREAKGERAKERREKHYARELAIRDKVLGKIRAAGGAVDSELRVIPVKLWHECWAIVGDLSGRAALRVMGRCKHKIAVGMLRRALVKDSGASYSWASLRARRIVAGWHAMVTLQTSTGRAGRWSGLVMGIPQGAFAALLRNPHEPDHDEATPHKNTLFDWHRAGDDVSRAQKGYFCVLQEEGLFYPQQLPTKTAEQRAKVWACELIGPSGRATNRYWVVTSAAESITDDELRYAVFGLEALGQDTSLQPPGRAAAPPAA